MKEARAQECKKGAGPSLKSAPSVVLGAERYERVSELASISPSRFNFFAPRGAAIIDDRLWVADTGHHRLLGWKGIPAADGQAAEILLGQDNYESEKRNGRGPIGSATLNVPVAICKFGASGLALADSWNHRVLIWSEAPNSDNLSADIVIGQKNFSSGEANQGNEVNADTLCFPSGVCCHEGRFLVADSGNRRVLIWNSLPSVCGQSADIVLGQTDFLVRDENAGNACSGMSMRWPHSLGIWDRQLCVSDAGNNRIMIWKEVPVSSGTNCDLVLGQNDLMSSKQNCGQRIPSTGSLNMPYGLSPAEDLLFVADTANSRILAWHKNCIHTGAGAILVLGQSDMDKWGDNRWMPASQDSFCWPYGVSFANGLVLVCDTGNNRISIWKSSALIPQTEEILNSAPGENGLIRRREG